MVIAFCDIILRVKVYGRLNAAGMAILSISVGELLFNGNNVPK